jgi:hypothetical protein
LTAAVDVQLSDEMTHRVTLYLVDWELDDRELEISLYALKDGTPIAPSLILRHFGNGTYVSFEVRSSFRVRIAHLNGGDAVMSSMFFDQTTDEHQDPPTAMRRVKPSQQKASFE